MKKLIKGLRALDYLVGGVTVLYGLSTQSPLVIGLGVAGLALARLNLAERLSTRLQKFVTRKRGRAVSAPLPEDTEVEAGSLKVLLPEAASYGQSRVKLGNLHFGTSRHNVLKGVPALNHSKSTASFD